MKNKERKIRAWWTSDGLCVEMPEEMAAELRSILMRRYEITVEEALRQYIEWIAEKPDEFKKWVEEMKKDEKACEYTEDLEDRADRRC